VTGLPLLSLAITVPIIGAVLLMLVPNRDGSKNGLINNLALAVSLVTLPVTLVLWAAFDQSAAAAPFQFVERHAWIPTFGIDYYVGIDGLSLMLLVLTGFLTPIALLSGWHGIEKHVKEFSILMLLLEASMIGVFCALDVFLFYIFWDFVLIPMYFMIGIWGYDQRIYAAVKFILYTMAGSVLMLIAIIGLSWVHQTMTGSTASTCSSSTSCRFRPTPSTGSSSPSRSPSSSRCRCFRSTPGCPTRTSRRRPAGR
jgi:NADH-quinone oxidoreductase subunit M